MPVKSKRSKEDHDGSAKRVKAAPPQAAQEEFSLDRVVANVKKAAVEHAHLPEMVVSTLFEQDATVSFLTTDQASWVYHVPRWYWHVFEHATSEELRSAEEEANGAEDSPTTWSTMFAQAWEAHPTQHDTIMMFGKPTKLPRFQQLCGEMGSYRYAGKTFQAEKKFPSGLRHAVQHLQRIVEDPVTNRTRLSGGLVNWYENGAHYIGPHADDERDMMACSPIVALSLGATRRFVFTKKTSKTAPAGDQAVARMELQMEDGDLMIMGGTTQRTHKHAVPKMARCKAPRISITLRCFH
jgi:alkylated DNA repair dioxygenase AlkB